MEKQSGQKRPGKPEHKYKYPFTMPWRHEPPRDENSRSMDETHIHTTSKPVHST